MSIEQIKAFTLAEVLITLAIIGVIAAMTIPSLISSTNNTEIITAVKKYNSVFAQAVMRYQAENNCIGDLSACDGFAGDNNHAGAFGVIKPFLNISKDCGTAAGTGCMPDITNKFLNGVSDTPIDDITGGYKAVLADGSLIIIGDNTGNCTANQSKSGAGPLAKECAWITVDVNGAKGPNITGILSHIYLE